MPEQGEILATQASLLLPLGLAVALDWADPTRAYPMMPGENLSGMVPRRAREFSAGRHAARRAMLRLGVPPLAVPQGVDRAPIWPGGMVGSISHSSQACIAAVTAELRGIGIDIELDTALDPDLAAVILGPDDRFNTDLAADTALLIFSAKEAAYKAQYPLTRRVLGAEDLVISLEGSSFTARLTAKAQPSDKGKEIKEISGRLALTAGHILALAWLA